MAGKPEKQLPSFFWQGFLILLPVAGLACFGLYSLRQDRLLAEQEARESGEVLAQRLVQAIGTEAVRQLRDYRNRNSELHANRTADLGMSSWAGGGEAQSNAWLRIHDWQRANPEIDLATMPPTDRNTYFDAQPEMMPPRPPDWLGRLNPKQQQLWQAAKESEFNFRDLSATHTAIEKFLASEPPKGARANAEYLLLLAKTHDLAADEAVAKIAEFSWSHWGNSSEPSEAGLPLGQLICYQALRRLPDGAGLPENFIRHQTIGWMIGYRASLFSPILIKETERVVRGTPLEEYAATLKAWWNADAASRRVLNDFRTQHATNSWNTGPFWVDSGIGRFLLLLGERQITPTNFALPQTVYYDHLLFPQAVVEKSLVSAVSKSKISLPSYAQVEFEMAGKAIALSRGQIGMTTNTILPELGQASGVLKDLPLNPHDYPFRIRVSLASPEVLYARQSQRTWMFGALIVLSALAAMMGLATAWRSFRRQLQLNDQKSNFVSSVSHELRAQIVSVRLMAESLERGTVSEPQKQSEYFKFIVQECRRLSALIENVLDFSRIEQGRKQYEFEPTDLLALTRETVKLMEPYAAEKGVELKWETLNIEHSTPNTEGTTAERQARNPKSETPSLELEVDGRAIQQALVNLIDNAVKHSAKGQAVQIELSGAGCQVSGKDEPLNATSPTPNASAIINHRSAIHLSVSDHGPGIPAHEQEKIFERFYRLGSELRRETQGVGIGLSIVKHIVEAQGGCVRVESEVGKGSRFTIELPASK